MEYLIASLQAHFGATISLQEEPGVETSSDMLPVYLKDTTSLTIDSKRLPVDVSILWSFAGKRLLSPEEIEHILLCSRMIGQKIAEKEQLDKKELFRQFSALLGRRSEEAIVVFDTTGQVIYQNTTARNRRIISRFESYMQQTEDKLVETKNTHTFYLGGTAPIQIDIQNIYRGTDYLGRIIIAKSHSGQEILTSDSKLTHDGFLHILGKDKRMKKTMQIARKAAVTDATVLLRGESGTGKEQFAQAIHEISARGERPFIAINCAAIPENLLESELFGYEEGSFTGAAKGGKLGKIEAADTGTIFLDEIGDMPPHLQAKLLRVVQSREFERVGGTKSISVDVRFISATHRDLSELMLQGTFRPDLYYRLNVIPIHIPALREHPDDIDIMLNYYLKKYAIRNSHDFSYFSYEALRQLKSYRWPGNVRELENVVQYCMTMTSSDEIGVDDLPPGITIEESLATDESLLKRTAGKKKASFDEIFELLGHFGDDTEGKRHTAAHLKISVATLYRRLQEENA